MKIGLIDVGTRNNIRVYILSNFDSTIEQDLERVYFIRDLGFSPYLTIYNKEALPKGHELRKIQRFVNNRWVFNSCSSYEEYMNNTESKPVKGQMSLF